MTESPLHFDICKRFERLHLPPPSPPFSSWLILQAAISREIGSRAFSASASGAFGARWHEHAVSGCADLPFVIPNSHFSL